jgi:hypothetical protein
MIFGPIVAVAHFMTFDDLERQARVSENIVVSYHNRAIGFAYLRAA